MKSQTASLAYARRLLRAAVTVAGAGVTAVVLASPSSAAIYDKQIAVDCPQPYSQECNAVGGADFPADGDLFVEFRGDPRACADIIGHIYVNGNEFASGRTGPGQNNFAAYINGSDVPSWGDNRYHVTMRADGVPGGCNTGSMSGWAGTLHVETGNDA
jgi:hypothetical protein